MKILAIDTSCDETSVAVTEGRQVIANVIWSQIALHEEWGGVVPSIAKRAHQERLDEIIKKALNKAKNEKPEAVAVTIGPGLAIALEVGIAKAKELSRQWSVPLIAVNHVEGHLLSPLAKVGETKQEINFPTWGVVVSGGHTELVYMKPPRPKRPEVSRQGRKILSASFILGQTGRGFTKPAIKEIGNYQIIASTQDDALGEALDKAARMLGLGYPGGAFLEKLAEKGESNAYPLPLPMKGKENQNSFSYSGIKTAMWQLVEKLKQENEGLNKKQIEDLAASFQMMAFRHLTRVTKRSIENSGFEAKSIVVGGGVIANKQLRKDLRFLGKSIGLPIYFPLNKTLCGDNAGMIGVVAGFKLERGEIINEKDIDKIDRIPRLRVDQVFEI